MKIADTTLLQMTKAKMQYHTERHQILAQNVANSETPEYKAKDLRALDFDVVLRRTNKLPLSRTSHMHISAPDDLNRFRAYEMQAPYGTTVDGNSVVLEEQMIKLNTNLTDHQFAMSVFRKYKTFADIAIGKQGAA